LVVRDLQLYSKLLRAMAWADTDFGGQTDTVVIPELSWLWTEGT